MTQNMVMMKVNVAEAKARFSSLLDAALRGGRIILSRRNVEVAGIRRLPLRREAEPPAGTDRGMEIPDSFFEPLPEEILRALEGAGGPDEDPR